MTIKEAYTLVLGFVYCHSDVLRCEDCPIHGTNRRYHEEPRCWAQEEVAEATKLLKMEMENREFVDAWGVAGRTDETGSYTGQVLTINGYQQEALRTANGARGVNIENGALGLCGESGEIADMVKKHLFQGHDLDKEHLAKELGDVAWYLAVAAKAIGYDMETILQMNVNKLRKRYPDGFSAERSQHREAGDV